MAGGAGSSKFEIVGEFVDHISPGLKEIAAKNIPELIGAFAALAAIEATKFLSEMINKAAEVGDQLSKMSQVTGASTESLSGMRLVLAEVGVSLEQYGDAQKELNKKLTESLDPTSRITTILRTLGINAKDTSGHLKTADVVIGELADKFKDAKDGPGKVAAAMELLGESGVRLIPILNQGSAALEEYKRKNAALGLTWSKEQAADANTFKDAITDVAKAFQGFGEIIAKDLINKLATIVQYLAESADTGGILRGVLDGLAALISGPVGAALDFLSSILSTIAFGFQLVGKFAGAAFAAIRFAAEGDLKAANEVFNQFNKDMDETWARYKKFNEDVWSGRKPEEKEGGPKKKDLGDLGLQAQKEMEAYKGALVGLQKELANTGQSGKTMEIMLETQIGSMKYLTKAHKEELIEYARKIDVAKMHMAIIQQEITLREQLVGKVSQAEVAMYLSQTANLKERAGLEAAMNERLAMQALYRTKIIEAERNKDKDVQQRLENELNGEMKLYEQGGRKFEQAKKFGEMTYELTTATKSYNEAIGTSLQTENELIEAAKQYKTLRDSGQITLERYTELVKQNTRAQEDNKLALTAAGKAFASVVGNRRGIEDTKLAMDEMKKAFADGKINAAEYEAQMYSLQQNLDSLDPTFTINQLQRIKDELRSSAAAFEGMFSNGIFDMMQGKWTNLGDLVKQTIDRMVANMIAAKIQFALFGDLGSTPAGKTPNSTGLLGGLFTSFFGGFREGGGPVEAGKAYIVGEKRPEVFVPQSNGSIISDAASVTGGGSVNQNTFYISALDGADVMKVLSSREREIAQMSLSATRKYNLR
jgi:hypothetical protein